jgi:hypothetical protein
MGYLVVENFGAGLDSRKSFLTTPAGALLTCKNAHITRGKEIEKRKKFAVFVSLPSGTFGLHAAANTLFTFGSADIAGLIQSGITYQRLIHPTGSSMTELVFSESFNGKVYAIAKFADGSIYHYFDGKRVTTWDSVSSSVGSISGVASALAEQIDAESQFSATASGSVITITGPVNAAFTLSLSAVNGGSINDQGMAQANSQSASVSQSQITIVTISGTFEANDRYSILAEITSVGYSKQFSISASSSGIGKTAKTFGNKVYSTTQSLVYFSQVGDPTQWGGTSNGAGFINVLNQDGGAENLTAMSNYQGKLALFSRRNVQIWTMDPDPSKNVQSQTLANIGTFATRSVVPFGDLDVFFLSDSGVRSIRARDASNAATVSDIGTAIDTLIQAEMSVVSESARNSAVGIIEPTDGRYWLVIGSKIYVFSYFTGSSVAAWSTYEPGFDISHLTYANGRIYARGGDTVYLYGGASGNEYDDCEVEVTLPYLDGGKPAHTKTIDAIDMGCEGTWDVYVGMDVSQPSARDYSGTIANSTYMLGRLLHYGIGTHIGVRLVNKASGYARLSNFAIHYTLAGAE